MRVLKESFNAGEFTPRLYSRYELQKYKNGCKTLTNFLPLAQGPITRRPGFEYIAEVKDSEQGVRLIPFEFSATDSYIIEAGNLYFRFYRNGGQIQTVDTYTKLLLHFDGTDNSTDIEDSGDTDHTVTVNNNVKINTAQKKFGPSCCYFGVSDDYLSIADHADWYMSTGVFTIDFWVRFYSNYGDKMFFKQGSGTDYWDFRYDYTGDYLELRAVASSIQTIQLKYEGWSPQQDVWYHISIIRGWGGNANDWALCINGTAVATLTDISEIPDITDEFVIGSEAGTQPIKGWIDEFRVSKGIARWTSSFSVPVAQYPFGDSSGTVYELTTTYTQDVLDDLYFVQSADTMYIVHEDFVPRKLVRSDHDNWAISDVSFTNAPDEWGAADYPRTIDFYEDRLVFGGNPNDPDKIYTSDTSLYTTFTEADASDDESVQLTLAATKVNDILWISGGRKLIIGTRGEEWWLSGPSDTEPLTPSDHVAKRDSAWGSERIMPVNIGDAIFFVQRNGKILREMRYDFGSDRYVSTDMIVLSEHLTKDYKIKSIAYQQHPYQILWCVREDGVLLALTYLKEHDVLGWSKHTSADGEFESIAVIPGTSEDELWAIIKRTINGDLVKYIERMKPFNWGSSLEDAFFIDSGLTYDGAETSTISGLDHLEGESLSGLADGVVVSDLTVTSGSVTLEDAASKIHLGLPYTPEMETLDAVISDREGPLQGVIKRIANTSIFLVNSMGGLFGSDSSHTDSIDYDDTTEPFTGWTRDMPFNEGSDNEATVYIQCNEPLPMEIGAILIEGDF